VDNLLNQLKSKSTEGTDYRTEIYRFLQGQFAQVQTVVAPEVFRVDGISKKPYVMMIVGVNGAGKTTTIGKLATRLSRQGAKVVVGACDTFRAAAVDQLQVWCDRAGATMVRAKENSAPSGVGYQALEQAIREGADYCLLDTAGRLHTKDDLMQELEKSKRVLSKLMPDAPHQVLLVLDAIAGQNSLRQAQEFHKALGLTGLIFTKCDGSSKAGSAVAIVSQLKLPIAYIGVGEGVEDLDKFETDEYLKALLHTDTQPSAAVQ
jgi:fused signal recognition particle receptor